MKPLQEWLRLFMQSDAYESDIKILSEIQKEAWNAAIDAAAENARTTKTGNSGSWYDAGVDKESILKLKK